MKYFFRFVPETCRAAHSTLKSHCKPSYLGVGLLRLGKHSAQKPILVKALSAR